MAIKFFKAMVALALFITGAYLASHLLKFFDLPISAINEYGKCEYVLIIEDDQEKKVPCSSDWQHFEKRYILSQAAQQDIEEQLRLKALVKNRQSRASN